MPDFCLAKPEANAADVAATFFELFYVWRKADETTFFELSLKFWSLARHDDVLAGADEIIRKTFSALVKVDGDFIKVCKWLDFAIGLFVERVWAVGDGVLVDDGNCEVKIIPKTVGVMSKWIDVLSAISVKLRLGVDLNEI